MRRPALSWTLRHVAEAAPMAEHPALRTRLTDLLDCEYPIVQAGMGGPARSELCAAVSNAGAFGCIGMVKERPEVIRTEIEGVRARTSRPARAARSSGTPRGPRRCSPCFARTSRSRRLRPAPTASPPAADEAQIPGGDPPGGMPHAAWPASVCRMAGARPSTVLRFVTAPGPCAPGPGAELAWR